MKNQNLLTVSYLNYVSLRSAVKAAIERGDDTFMWFAPDDERNVELVTRFAAYLLIYLENQLGVNK